MPRRGRFASPMSRGPPSRPAQTMPVRPAPMAPAHPPTAQPRQPGMFSQIASTAAGVAVESAVGHTIGADKTGGGGWGQNGEVQQVQPQQVYQEPVYQQQPQQMELKQFIECTQTQNDISMCQGYNEVLKDCKIRFGMM